MRSTLLLLWTPCFCSRLFRVAAGFSFLVFLYLVVHICPNCMYTQLFLVPYSFFVFCCSRRRGDVSPGESMATKGLRSEVPACLSSSAVCRSIRFPILVLTPVLGIWQQMFSDDLCPPWLIAAARGLASLTLTTPWGLCSTLM